MWYEACNSIESGYITHLKVSLSDKIMYRPGSCLITPKTPLLVSICCLGYQSETIPYERRFHTSIAPASVARTTDFLMKPFTRCIILPLSTVCSPSLLAVIPLWIRPCGTRRPGCTVAQWRRWQESGSHWFDHSHRLNCLHTNTNPPDCLYQRKDRKYRTTS